MADRSQLTSSRPAPPAARQVGAMDLGQAAVVAGARVVAVEDVAGNDDLLARVARYRAAGLIGDGTEVPVVLAKASKPQQPLFVDLPAIGPETVTGAADAGISVIAVEAGRTLLLERGRLVEAANRHGIAIVGLAIDG
jgi:UDP-2,3-diacylglucosamine hydrolase